MTRNTLTDGAKGTTNPIPTEVLELMTKKGLKQEDFFSLAYIRRDGTTATGWFLKAECHDQPHLVYGRVLSKYRSGEVLEAGQCVLNDCWVCGDSDFKDIRSLVHITAARDLTNHVDFLEKAAPKV